MLLRVRMYRQLSCERKYGSYTADDIDKLPYYFLKLFLIFQIRTHMQFNNKFRVCSSVQSRSMFVFQLKYSNFSLCVVTSGKAKTTSLKSKVKYPLENFLHNRLDLKHPDSPCIYRKHLSSSSKILRYNVKLLMPHCRKRKANLIIGFVLASVATSNESVVSSQGFVRKTFYNITIM